MPVIIKSLYGGGGRGMKVAYNEEQLISQFASVSSEANAAFGRPDVYLEHYIPSPRHLEVQVLSDDYGHIKILGDRECSIQRRHQKVIEEAPIPNIDEGIRNNMWAWSKKIMNSIDFQGLGTIEFLMDQGGNVFFLEINGRLQVEHPVTEMITGIDMVREQILVAAGANIDITPLSITGHAIECRINAENPSKNFMPTTGVVRKLRLPGGPGVRVDTHLFVGCEVSSFYDPLLAKLIAFDNTRSFAISRMSRMLDETIIEGILTNKGFLANILRNKHFLDAKGDTSLVTQILGG
jgi:acetyl-CoA carboxylase biotin carboxylase subunit